MEVYTVKSILQFKTQIYSSHFLMTKFTSLCEFRPEPFLKLLGLKFSVKLEKSKPHNTDIPFSSLVKLTH